MAIEPAKPPAPKTRKITPAPSPRISRREARENAVNEIGGGFALIAAMKGWYADAGTIGMHGPKFAHELALVADDNEQVGTFLDYLTQSGPWLGVIKVGLPMILQFAANHGRIDTAKLPADSGIIEPKMLEERVKAEMRNASEKIRAEIRMLEQQTADMQRSNLQAAM